MRIVVKVGTSTLAHSTGRLNIRHTEDLVKVLSDLKNAGHEVILVSSGAIGMGVGTLSLPSRPGDMATKQACAAVGQCELMYTYDRLFTAYNHNVAQILLTGVDVEHEGRRLNFQNTLTRLLELGALPIINENDTVATDELLNYQYPIIFGQNLDQLLQGTYLNTIPNYSARWETTEQTSAGLDLTMFKNKLNISVDYYHKVTKDLIDYIPTPEQIGVADPPMGNMGNVLNKGWEFSVIYNGSAAQGKLTYNVWGNFSTNKGYVREYGVRQGAVMHTSPNLNSNPILYSDAGQPWYSFMVYRTAGSFRSQDEINKYIYKNPETGEAKLLMPDAKVGDLIFIDTNNDGVINDDDKTFAGSYTPKNTFSFGGSLNWKGFDFSFFFQGVTGNKVYNGLKQMAMNGRNDYGNLISDVYNSWDFNPQGSKYPRLGLVTGSDTNGNYSKFSDIFLEDGDYLRLKNITLGYTLPKSVSRFVGMENGSLRVYISVDNVCTITGYSGVDPEVGNYGIDRGVYPVSRFFNFGVNINF